MNLKGQMKAHKTPPPLHPLPPGEGHDFIFSKGSRFISSPSTGEGEGEGAHLSSEKGFALVLTLMILVLITAMVVEFSYGVYTTTSALHNWKDSQRLSFVSKSGISLALKTISDFPQNELYRFPGKMEIPVENILEGFTGTVIVSVEDENAKFNLNSLVYRNGQLNTRAYESFKRLLRNFGLDEGIADRIVDWIDTNNEPRLRDSEENAKNAYMDSVDELLRIKGIDRQTYEILLPYITVYGYEGTDSDLININTASIPVIMSFNISKERAEEIVNYRKLTPFKSRSDLSKVPGFEGPSGTSLMNRIAVQAVSCRIISVSEENKIKRVIESVVAVGGISQKVKYWREM
jgi:general secretion pathway protein K